MTTLPPLDLAQPATLDINGYRGDTHRFRVTVTRNGTPLDVSQAAWDADVRQTADGVLVGTMTVAPVAGQTSVVEVTLPATFTTPTDTSSGEDPGPFVGVWDLEMTFGTAPNPVETTTILRGTITLTRDVSRPTLSEPEGGGPSQPGTLGAPAPAAGLGQRLARLVPGEEPERVGGPEAPEVQPLDAVSPRGLS